MNIDQINYENHDDYTEVKEIAVEYCGPRVVFNLDEILENLKEHENKTYTKEQIKYSWVKWNVLHIEFEDGYIHEETGSSDWYIDCKRPAYFSFIYTNDWEEEVNDVTNPHP